MEWKALESQQNATFQKYSGGGRDWNPGSRLNALRVAPPLQLQA